MSELQDFKETNAQVTRVLGWGWEGRGEDRKILEEITAEEFPNLMETINPTNTSISTTPRRINIKKTAPRHTTKLLKTRTQRKY